MELIVRTGTDQGMRQLGKVARIYEVGTRRLMAELENPRLVWLRRSGLVLTGIERHQNEHKQLVGCSQTWACKFAPPYDVCEMRIAERLVKGIKVASRYVREKGWEGHVVLNQEYVPELGRHAAVASYISGSTAYRRCLLDADLQWMSEDRFSLGGLHRVLAHGREPEVAYDGSWLCFFNPPRHQGDR
ncbi:hypothetical protein ACHMW6_25650 [Pseudoduganella sp. UC29_106]|uniref:hypothetical protein n=1 Tax=Pseudoduganella sp. UC29_106 TaxID=3374553 RepID=UPI003757BBFD